MKTHALAVHELESSPGAARSLADTLSRHRIARAKLPFGVVLVITQQFKHSVCERCATDFVVRIQIVATQPRHLLASDSGRLIRFAHLIYGMHSGMTVRRDARTDAHLVANSFALAPVIN